MEKVSVQGGEVRDVHRSVKVTVIEQRQVFWGSLLIENSILLKHI
jgi:hypothetical protein